MASSVAKLCDFEARFVLTKANLVRTRLVGSELKFLAMPSARGVNQ